MSQLPANRASSPALTRQRGGRLPISAVTSHPSRSGLNLAPPSVDGLLSRRRMARRASASRPGTWPGIATRPMALASKRARMTGGICKTASGRTRCPAASGPSGIPARPSWRSSARSIADAASASRESPDDASMPAASMAAISPRLRTRSNRWSALLGSASVAMA